jgi:hypothetical protein
MSRKKSPEEKISHVAPFGLRMLPDLKEKLAAAAHLNGRSLNAEITHRLEYSFMVRFPLEETRSPQIRIAELAAKIVQLSQKVVDESSLTLLDGEKEYLRYLNKLSEADLAQARIPKSNVPGSDNTASGAHLVEDEQSGEELRRSLERSIANTEKTLEKLRAALEGERAKSTRSKKDSAA